ncbi:hypothetical protein [Lysobacter sp. A3-1-A15]|uniref:hypothetical protein n=1 Tax=Novilysobacter viscosus TaxID=3098602 RepID=UPI002EDB5BAC
MRRIILSIVVLGVASVLAACRGEPPAPVMDTAAPATADTAAEPARSTETGTVPVPRSAAISAAVPDFVGRTWRVAYSSAVAEGTRYRFHADGRLEIVGPGSEPITGSWRMLEDARIEMTEDGLAYPVDIVEQTRRLLRLRSHNPGEPVDIAMVPAS